MHFRVYFYTIFTSSLIHQSRIMFALQLSSSFYFCFDKSLLTNFILFTRHSPNSANSSACPVFVYFNFSSRHELSCAFTLDEIRTLNESRDAEHSQFIFDFVVSFFSIFFASRELRKSRVEFFDTFFKIS